MSKSPKEMYAVPDWMRPHLALFQNTGGNDVEELLHDEDTSMFANSIRYMLIVSVRSQFSLLVDMHNKGLLSNGVSQPAPVVPDEMTPEMMRAVQLNTELGSYAAANLSGAYELFNEFWKEAHRAAMQPKDGR